MRGTPMSDTRFTVSQQIRARLDDPTLPWVEPRVLTAALRAVLDLMDTVRPGLDLCDDDDCRYADNVRHIIAANLGVTE